MTTASLIDRIIKIEPGDNDINNLWCSMAQNAAIHPVILNTHHFEYDERMHDSSRLRQTDIESTDTRTELFARINWMHIETSRISILIPKVLEHVQNGEYITLEDDKIKENSAMPVIQFGEHLTPD